MESAPILAVPPQAQLALPPATTVYSLGYSQRNRPPRTTGLFLLVFASSTQRKSIGSAHRFLCMSTRSVSTPTFRLLMMARRSEGAKRPQR
jgi:hypothetical protein